MSFTEHRNGGLVLMTSGLLEKTGKMRHAFTTRYGGVSKGIFRSLNLAVNRGDDKTSVLRNYQILCEYLKVHPSDLVFSSQVHRNEVRPVSALDRKRDLFASPPYSADALITSAKGLPLIIFVADCIPILLYGEGKNGDGAVGAVHAGWRGTVLDIAGKAVKKMETEFGCLPDTMRAAVGPGIGSCCFETGPEVAGEIMKLSLDDPAGFIEMKNGKPYIDLKGVNRALLTAAGLKDQNIEVSDECTICAGDKYWSHRGTKGKRGSQAAVICLA